MAEPFVPALPQTLCMMSVSSEGGTVRKAKGPKSQNCFCAASVSHLQ